jgi:hypothetical protein
MTYSWDVFISYPRRDPVGPWVRDRFHPLLSRWLGAALIERPRVFLDCNMEDGTHWPTNLQSCLARSKYMVAVLAPPYFGSSWCLAEWETMRRRQDVLGLGRGTVPGLIQQVRFIDGDSFPPEAQAVQDAHSDYRPFNRLPPGRSNLRSRDYKLFESKIQELAEVLAHRIGAVPPWQPDWPQLEIPPEPAPSPRLRFNQIGLG